MIATSPPARHNFMTLTLSKDLREKAFASTRFCWEWWSRGSGSGALKIVPISSRAGEWTADIARKRGILMARLGKPQEPAQALLF